MSADTLSDVLHHVRLCGAVFFDIDASAPWVAETPPARAVAPYIMPGAEHVIEYHLVVSGTCYGRIAGDSQVELTAGDLIVFPQGDPHVMSSSAGLRAKPEIEIHQRPPGALLPIALQMNGGGERAQVICGFLGCDARPSRAARRSRCSPSLHSRSRRVGVRAASARFRACELLFIAAVRRYVQPLAAGAGRLARGAARSTGGSGARAPARASGTRLEPRKSAERLRGTSDSLSEIAERAGYGSESALSRAFKRLVGVAPAVSASRPLAPPSTPEAPCDGGRARRCFRPMPASKMRCAWAGSDPLYVRYHDEEWGVPVEDDRLLFEFLVLEGAQAGLSWITILRKRAAYRKAFARFDPKRVARFGAKDVKRLLADAGIVRNRLKVESAIKNASAFLEVQAEFGTFSAYQWRFVDGRPLVNRHRSMKEVPARTAISDAFSKDLRARGFSFVGSTIVYAHMQAVGMVNDHVVDCFRHRALGGGRRAR